MFRVFKKQPRAACEWVSTEWGIDHEVCEVGAGLLNQYEDAGFYCEWLANMSWEHKAQSLY